MNGAEQLVQNLVDLGVDTCITNPGTSEMHFVKALDSIDGMRPVLGLTEGVVTGAADGYGRMAGKPAVTLLHLGPGLANGWANLHNARRAESPVLNVVGDHPAAHLQYDTPLQSDIDSIARPVSRWVRTVQNTDSISAVAADAVSAANGPPGSIATLILPADISWGDTPGESVRPVQPQPPKPVSSQVVEGLAAVLSRREPTLILMRGEALLEEGLAAASRLTKVCNARIFSDTFVGRLQRGAGRAKIQRMPYFADGVADKLAGVKHLVLVGTRPPVSFFSYQGKPSWLTPGDCEIHTLSNPDEDGTRALQDLADALNAPGDGAALYEPARPDLETGKLTQTSIAVAAGALLPENVIVSDESGTSGMLLLKMTAGIPAHDWLFLTGGSIGQGIPAATGAALACPGRKVVCFCGDGGAMQTIQALWTQARENLDVTTVIFSNRRYAILQVEMDRVGGGRPGPRALGLTSLDNPELDFVRLAQGMGVAAERVTTADEFNRVFEAAMAENGPRLIEAVI